MNDAKPALPPNAKELALDFAENREMWEALLKRQFVTLKADGPYILEQAEVTALVVDRLGSMGDPPRRLRLKLVRFRLEGIDTGWKVVSARRIQQGIDEAEPGKSPAPTYSISSQPPQSLHDVPAGR